MKRWLQIFLVVGLGVGIYFWLHSSATPQVQQEGSTAEMVRSDAQSAPAAPAAAVTARSQPAAPEPTPSAPTFAPPPPSLAAAAGQLQPPVEPTGIPPENVVANMRRTVRQYNQIFGGNPVGTNPEITRALNGGNPRHVNFLQPDSGNRINENGELVDPWGTPYFFHQLSASDMEVRSAGPDKILYTQDDLVKK